MSDHIQQNTRLRDLRPARFFGDCYSLVRKAPNDSLGSFRADVKILRNNTQEARVVFVAVRKHESPQRWCGSHFNDNFRSLALDGDSQHNAIVKIGAAHVPDESRVIHNPDFM